MKISLPRYMYELALKNARGCCCLLTAASFKNRTYRTMRNVELMTYCMDPVM